MLTREGCKKSDSSRLLKELGNQGITVPINRSKKSNGAKKVGLCKSQNAIRTTMDKYFDPAFGIRQFVRAQLCLPFRDRR